MKRVAWLVNRIRVMSLPEILLRGARAVLQLVERLRVVAGWRPRPREAVTAGCALFGTHDSLLAQWQAAFRLDPAALSDGLAGRIGFFGHPALDVGRPVDWQRDPVTGIRAPARYGKALNYRDDRLVGNVKFTWELGRHQHLVPLAVAYAVTGEMQYRAAVLAQIEGWIDDNPFAIGIHWCSALEPALRLLSWALVHSLLVLRDGPQGLFAQARDPRRLGDAIYQQAFFVRHYLSRHSSANNHLIGELTGLFTACAVFDMGPRGERWAAYAQRQLEREAALQVFDDGVDREQAVYYHLWVLDYLTVAWLTGLRAGRPFTESFRDRLPLMARFIEDLAPPGGEPPQIGDADDGFVARFSPCWPQHPYREMLATIHALCGDGPVTACEKAFWYCAMRADGAELPAPAWRRDYPLCYPRAGYAILGNDRLHLVMDAGELGYPAIAAHGHADALAFCLALDGAWWLVDPGTYAYHSAALWRNYFRGTAAHNTVRVNGRDQSRIGGAFLWLDKAMANLEDCTVNSNIQYARGVHDGYRRDGITHARELRLDTAASTVEVLDELSGSRPVQAEIFFHFAPGTHISRTGADNCWSATRPDSGCRLLVHTDPDWDFDCVAGSTDPVAGWYSPALEEKMPAPVLRGRACGTRASRCRTRLVVDGLAAGNERA